MTFPQAHQPVHQHFALYQYQVSAGPSVTLRCPHTIFNLYLSASRQWDQCQWNAFRVQKKALVIFFFVAHLFTLIYLFVSLPPQSPAEYSQPSLSPDNAQKEVKLGRPTSASLLPRTKDASSRLRSVVNGQADVSEKLSDAGLGSSRRVARCKKLALISTYFKICFYSIKEIILPNQ